MKKEYRILVDHLKKLDRKVVWIFVCTAIFQTISWYYTSRIFFRKNLFEFFKSDQNVFLWEYVYWFAGDFIPFFVLPVIIIKYVFKESLKDYGLKLGDKGIGLKITLISILVMIPLLWFVSASPEFSAKYPHLQSAKSNLFQFVIYEIAMLFYLFSWEFIWRGFMLFGLEKKFGIYSIFIQMIPFVILHNGKPELETFSAILGGIILGYLAYRTRSFLYGVAIHFGIMFLLDLFSIYRFHLLK